jgi:type I restriction enzyme S subunit
MEVKPGYKLTDVGVFPIEWEVTKLGELATLKTGPFGSLLHKSDYTLDGVPVVNPIHIVDGQIIPDRRVSVTPTAVRAMSDFCLREGDVVLARRGDMGRCAVVGRSEDGWLCGTGSLIVRSGNRVVPAFLQRVLSSPQVIQRIEDASVGSTMANLNHSVLHNLLIQKPPLPEQKAIASALGDVDALIGSLDRLIAKKRDLKQAAMRQLITGQTRLPEFSPTHGRELHHFWLVDPDPRLFLGLSLVKDAASEVLVKELALLVGVEVGGQSADILQELDVKVAVE